jgi:hypothetical protein
VFRIQFSIKIATSSTIVTWNLDGFDVLRDDTAWQRQAQRMFPAFCWLEDRRWPRCINGL